MKSSLVPALLRCLFAATLMAAAMPALAALSQAQKLVSPDFTTDTPLNIADEQFGNDVAVSGNWLAVGAPSAAAGAGRVQVYERVSGAWELRTSLASPSAQLGAEFGASVDIYENAGIVTIIAGSPGFDASFANQGRAYVFIDSDASALLNFSTTTTLNSVSPENDGRFGHAVGVFGDIAAVSEPYDGVTDDGLVSIRGRNVGGSNAWGQAVAPKSGNLGNRFGTSLDVHGEYLIIGAPLASDGLGVRSGQAYVYRQDQGGSNAWGVKHTLSPAGPADEAFGHAVGIWDSDTAAANSASRSIVGRPLFDNSGFANVGGVIFFQDAAVNFTRTHTAIAGNVNAQMGYSVAIDGDNAFAGRPNQVVTTQPNTGQIDSFSFNGTVWATNTINLTETGAERGNFYGRAVDVSGALAVVGAPNTKGDALTLPPGSQRAGAVETFTKPGPTWVKTGSKLQAVFDLPYSVASQKFGLSQAVSGDWMAIGVQGDGHKGSSAGTVYMYRKLAGAWTPHSKLTALYGRAGDGFGTSVALQGSRLVVGAPSADGFPTTLTDSGAIYLFVFNGTSWVQSVERTSPNPVASGFFGYSLDLHGDVLAVGAVGENGNTGRAYAYRDLSTLSSPITLTISGLASGNRAGESVSVYDPASGTPNDEVIAVGVPFQSADVGAAYVLSDPSFATVTPLANPAPAIRFFGLDVSIFNGRVAVGAPTATAAPSGAAYVFSGVGYATVDTMVPTGSPGQFGFSVSLNDTQLLVGSPASNGRAGLGHLFTRSGATWAQTDLLQPADLSANEEFGSSSDMDNGTFIMAAPVQNGAVVDAGSVYVYGQAPEVNVSPTNLAVSETGPTSDSFTVSLNQSPSANVTTALSFDANVQVDTGSGFGASPQTLTLTPANAVSGVSVSVRAVDDGTAEASPHPGDITTSVTASSDSLFSGLSVADVAVSITDNDNAGVVITQTGGGNAVSESGGTDTYTIVLGSQPTATVNVAINFPASDLTLNGDNDGTLNTSFTTVNWNTPQTITIAAINDRALEGSHAGTLTHTFASGDAAYNAVTAVVDGGAASNALSVAISDNETALLEWLPVSASAAEGASNTSAVRLDIIADPAGGTPSLEGTISYTLAATLGSAEAGDIGAIVGALAFTNVSDLATNMITIAHLTDTLVEGPELYSVGITLGSAPLGTSASASPLAGTILDANSATVSLSSGATVSESVGSTPLAVTLNTTAGTTLENAASVAINLADGTATYAGGSGDYFFTGPSNTITVNFPAGAGNSATQSAAVNVREDVLVEGTESFAASLGAVTGAISASGPGATVTITDNDFAVVSFQTASSSVGEASTPHSVNALLTITAVGTGTAALTTALSVAISQTPGTATTPADYSVSTTSVSFAAAAQSAATQPIAITIVDDAITEGDETFALGFGVVTGTGSASGSHSVTITDNDTPGITVAQTGTTDVAEGGATDSYTIVLNSQPTSDVTINIAYDSSQVTLNGDTDGVYSRVFTTANWNVAQPVTVTAVDDTVVEADPHSTSIVQTVASGDPIYALINPADVSVSIAENDSQQIVFALANSSVAETSASHVVNARLNLIANGSPGGTLSADMSADVFLTLASAEIADLSLVTTQLTFAAGSAHNATQPINLNLVNDRVLEGAETGSLSLGLVGALGSVSGTHTLTITDDEVGAISYTAPGSTTSESAGNYLGAISRLTITGTGTGGPGFTAEADVDVVISDTAGSAISPADYTRTTSTQTFPAGALAPVDLPVAVSIANDVLIENAESFTLGFGAVSGAGSLSASGTHGVSLSDNDSALVAFAAGNDSVSESAGSFSKPVTLTLTANGIGTASLQNALLVPVSFTEGTATEPEDFTLAAASVSFAAGSTTGAAQNATANLSNDLVSEATESFDLTLGNAFVTPNITLGRSATTVQILDNDTPGVTVIQSGGSTAAAESGATDSYTIVLNSQPTANVTITINPGTQLSATSPVIFTTANWNLAQTVTVSAVDDAIAEGSHSGTLTHTVASADTVYSGFAIADVTVTISDNDTAGVSVVESSGSTASTEGGLSDSYTVVLTSQPTADVTVALNASAQLNLPANLTFTPANWNLVQTVTVVATDDAVVEGPHSAAITQSTSSSDPNYSAAVVAGVNVSITDNDSATVQFNPASVSQSEGAGPMVFTVTLSNPVASGVTLDLNSTFGSASAADFTPISVGTVSFPAGSSASQTVNVVINNDALDEADEDFTLTLSNLTATGNVTLGTATATGTIQDNDATPAISITSPSQNEGNSGSAPMNFVVSLSAVSGRDVTFTRVTADGGATTANNDYVALVSGPATISAGQSSISIPVTINGDAMFEGNESFSLNVSGVVNATPGSLSGTGTIVEDDQQPTTTTITGAAPEPSQVAQPYLVSVTVSAQSSSPLGTVTIREGVAGPSCTANLTAGTAPDSSASCALTASSAGSKNLTADYLPASSAFAASSGSAVHQVLPATTLKGLVASVTPSRFGEPVTFSAQLAGVDPTGTVEFFVGATSLGTAPLTASPSGGVNLKLASLTVSSLPVGTGNIRVVYAGDANNAPSSSPDLPHTVLSASTRITLTPASNPILVGPLSVAIQVSAGAPGGGVPQGSVTLSAGAISCTAALTAGAGSCSLNLTATGYTAISASYTPGNGNHSASIGGTGVIVSPPNASADLRVRIGNGVRTIDPNQPVNYLIVVDNLGADPAVGRLQVPLSVDFPGATYSCLSDGPSACGRISGTGSIDTDVSLAPGGAVIYTLSVISPLAPERPLSQSATLSIRSPGTDPVLSNNSATDADSMGLFADGLEDASVEE